MFSVVCHGTSWMVSVACRGTSPTFLVASEEVGSPSQHALQLFNIQNRNFLHYHLEKLWKFASIFRQENFVFFKVSFYRCFFKCDLILMIFALFDVLMLFYLC